MRFQKLHRITTVPISLEKLLEGQMSFMSNHYEVKGISCSGVALNRVAEKESVLVEAVEMTRQITPLKDLKAVYQLYKIFRRDKPAIVHTHTPKAGTVGMLAAMLAGVPYRLHTIAGLPLLEAKGAKRLLLNIVEKITYACATKIYPNSFVMQRIIEEEGFTSKKKLKVIAHGSSNGIDTSYFSPDFYSEEDRVRLRNNLGIHQEDLVFVFVGRLVKDKGINELVFTFDKLSKIHKNIKLLLVGPFEAELDPLSVETSDSISKNKSIISVGFQSDVRPYFSISDVLTFPSYREGFPNVVMQAGAMGLPSIVTDINGCNEIIEEGKNGVIIPSKNKQALYESMEYMIKHSDQRIKMAKNARPMIMNRYERKIVWDALLEEYKSLTDV